MQALYKICDMLEDELDAISKKPEISQQDLQNLYTIIDILKDKEEILQMKHGGYSNGMMPPMPYMNYGNSYGRNSYEIRGTYDGRNGRDMYNDNSYGQQMDPRERFARDIENQMRNQGY